MAKFLSRKNFGQVQHILPVPNLIEIQKRSFSRFIQKDVAGTKRDDFGLQAAFNSVFPIVDYNETASIEFLEYFVKESKYNVRESLQKGINYSAPLKIKVKLNLWEKNEIGKKRLKESREEEVYLGELPLMTTTGTFIINGTERVVVSQLHRSPGVFFSHEKGKSLAGKTLFSARIIPARGSWFDFEFDSKEALYVRIDRRKKLPATIILKALGYLEEEILKMFYPIEEITIKGGVGIRRVSDALAGTRALKNIVVPKTKEVVVKEGSRITKLAIKRMEAAGIKTITMLKDELIGRVTLKDVIDPATGEVVLESNEEINSDVVEKIIGSKTLQLHLLLIDGVNYLPSVRNTLLIDKISTTDEALMEIYRKLRPGEPPTIADARELFRGLFFNPKRYDLSPVGRLKLNTRLGLDVPLDNRVLTDKDVVEILRYLLNLKVGKGEVDDIDHLGNRRIRSVGELLENQFRIGLVRMERAVKEKMTLSDIEDPQIMPHDLINAKPVIAVIKEFFGSSQLSQFMDQTNPLSEITHKRRLSALGPGGLTRERAGFEVRDVHPTHYGRICPVETPEGPNIGLITSLASYARVNDFGFIETPYRKINKGKVTEDIAYLSAIEEGKYVIAQATSPIDTKGNLVEETVSARVGGDFKLVTRDEVYYMDVSPKQIVSVSASLIPFLENDDANRALMGSNMQRQAVPLLHTEAPIVGTGMEHVAARDSGVMITAKKLGVVKSVDTSRIVVKSDKGVDVYKLIKFYRSNQGTCVNQKPIVRAGESIKKGQVIADGPATALGELALGKNVLVAFMPWNGYNFEDAFIISERLVKQDTYTSIHIEEFEIESRETKLGPEEITRDIPNVGEEILRNLDESGIVRIGAEVKPGDVLVGKVTPKGETQLTPEEKLLRAIFGEKAEEVRENCLYVPPGIEGTVIDVKVLARKGVEKDTRTKSIEKDEISRVKLDFEEEEKIIVEDKIRKMREFLVNQKTAEDIKVPGVKDVICKKGKKLNKEHIESVPDKYLHKIKLADSEQREKLKLIEKEADDYLSSLKSIYDGRIARMKKGDDLPPGVLKIVKAYIAMKRKVQVGDKMAGRHGNKGVIATVVPEEDMPYMPDGTHVDIVLNPLGVPSRMNVGQVLETHLGWAAKILGFHMATPVFEGANEKEIKELLEEAGLPSSGQVTLYDGKTGEPFQRKVSVGYMYMMKLHHLVEDKIHARSIGPYSLVTQQPLGGKAQFGGQRLGEMEVWALEAYGAAHTLQEFLTVKSDDVIGRARMYESIVKGDVNLESGVPESFHVLIKELQSLGLDVELLEEKTLPKTSKRKANLLKKER
jgi:DNA-directed RNA polymerase subunit beta